MVRANNAPEADADPGTALPLGLAALALAVGVLYPAGAYPTHGMVASMLLVVALLAGMRANAHAVLGRMAPLAGCLLATGWALWWAVRLPAAPVYTAGRGEVLIAFQAPLALLAGMVGIAAIEGRDRDATSRLGLWLSLGIGAMALHAIWQVTGPAWAPGTFRGMEAAILATPAEELPMREGMLHALAERRASGTMGAPNIFASFLACGLPVALAMAIAAATLRGRALHGGVAALIAVALVLTGSRGGILAAAGATGLLAALVGARTLPARWRVAVPLAVIAAGVLAVAVLSYLILSADGESRWMNASGMRQRFFYWQTAATIWGESPLLGVGPGAFEVGYPAARMPGANETRHAHSWLFQFGPSVGLVGIGLFLAAVGTGLTAGWRALVAPGPRSGRGALIAGLMAGAAAILMHGLVEYTFAYREATVLFWALLGVLLGLRTAPAESPEPAPPTPAQAGVMLPAVALVVWGILAVEAPAMRGETLREYARYLIQTQGDMAQILDIQTAAIEADPRHPEGWEARGLTRMMARRADAREDLERALALHPQSGRLREHLAQFHLQSGEPAAALAMQREAIAAHPLEANHLMGLVLMLHELGRTEEARAAFDEIRNLMLPNASDQARYIAIGGQLGLPEATLTTHPSMPNALPRPGG